MERIVRDCQQDELVAKKKREELDEGKWEGGREEEGLLGTRGQKNKRRMMDVRLKQLWWVVQVESGCPPWGTENSRAGFLVVGGALASSVGDEIWGSAQAFFSFFAGKAVAGARGEEREMHVTRLVAAALAKWAYVLRLHTKQCTSCRVNRRAAEKIKIKYNI